MQKDRKDQSAVGFDYKADVQKHASQISTTKPAIVNRIKVPEFKEEQENKPNNDANRSIGKVKVPDFQAEKQVTAESNQNKSIGKIGTLPIFENKNDNNSNKPETNKPVSTGKIKLPQQFIKTEHEDKTPPKPVETVNRGNANALKSKFESLIKDSDTENQRKIEEERIRRLEKEKNEKNKAKQEEEERQKKLKIEAEQRKLNEQFAEEEVKKKEQSDSDEEQVVSSSKVNKIGVSVLPAKQLTKQLSKTSNRSSSFDSDNENDFNDEEEKIDETKNSNLVNEIVNVERGNVNETISNQEEETINREREEEEIRRLRELELQRELEEEELRKKLAEEDESLGEDVSEEKEVSEIRAIAIYDYEAAEEDEISFLPGDIICNIEKVDSGWWRGNVQGTEKRALFPSNYVEELS